MPPDREGRRARVRRTAAGAAVALVGALLAAACGTRVDESTLRALGGEAGLQGPGGSAGAPGAALSGGTGVPGPGAAAPTGSAQAPAGGGSPGTTADGGRRSEILLGSWGTMSGIIGAILKPIPVANRAWVADINARGGLNGHPVRLIMRDDGGDPARGLAIARQMVEQDRVLAFFGTFGPVSQATIAEYLERVRVPVIGGATHDPSPMFFTPQAGLKGNYRAYLMSLVRQTPARKVAVLYVSEAEQGPQGAAEIRSYAPKVGVEVVYEARVSLAQPDYTAEILAARNNGADALIAHIDGPSTLRAARSAHRQGWRPPIVGGEPIYYEEFARDPDAAGVLAYTTTPPYSLSRRMAPYRDAVRRYVPGGAVGGFGGWSWVGGKLFERIAPSLGEPATRDQIFRALYALRDETLGGLVPPITFPRGARDRMNLCTIPMVVRDGRWAAPFGDTFVCAPD